METPLQCDEVDVNPSTGQSTRPGWVTFLQTLLVVTLLSPIVAWFALQGDTRTLSAWWGPLFIIADSATSNKLGGMFLLAGCIATFALGVWKVPKWWALLLAASALLAWHFCGVVGRGIGC